MTVLKVLQIPNPILKKVSEPVEVINDDIRNILDDMLETMYVSKGIGLAAPQVGILKRLVVIDVDNKDVDDEGNVIQDYEPLFFINPEIVEKSAETSCQDEGCLSVPGECEAVTRPDEVTIKFLDKNGKEHTQHMTGLLARCIQHEIDHLNGVVFVDKLSKLKKDIIMRRAKRREREMRYDDDE